MKTDQQMAQSEEEGEEKTDKRRISVNSDSIKSVILMSSEFQKEKEYRALKKKKKKKPEEIMTESFLNWAKLQTYRFKKLRLMRINLKKPLARHNKIKLLKPKDRGKLLKVAR